MPLDWNVDDSMNEPISLSGDIEKPQDRAVERISLWQILAALVMMAAVAAWMLLLTDKLIMPRIANKGVEVTIPDLHLMPFYDAELMCDKLGLTLVRMRMRIDNHHPAGIIVDQFPVSGTIVKPGKAIEVIYTVGSEVILCPILVGRSPREAVLIADTSGLYVDESKTLYAHSTRHPDGVVMRQIPEQFTTMMSGDTVRLVVSVGSLPEEVRAPRLIGQKIGELNRILIKHRVRLGTVTRYPDSSVPPNTVIAQTPEPDAEMNPGERVNVRIAVKPKTEQNVVE